MCIRDRSAPGSSNASNAASMTLVRTLVVVVVVVLLAAGAGLCFQNRSTERMKQKLLEVEVELKETGGGASLPKMVRDTVTRLGGSSSILSLHLSGSTADRYTTTAKLMVTGQAEQAARGINFFMKVEDSVMFKALALGIDAIESEINTNGTDVDKECLQYVLRMEAGSSDKTFQEGLKRDCAPDGSLLPVSYTHLTLPTICSV